MSAAHTGATRPVGTSAGAWIEQPAEKRSPRHVYLVLSPRALPYARLGLQTLLMHSQEPLHIALITDSAEDEARLIETVDTLRNPQGHSIEVVSVSQLDDLESSRFAGLDALRSFRRGHPCWRKITDPLMLSRAADEMIILDPDLYFPNPFSFETTPAEGVLLMWQKPNCLLPSEVVQAAMSHGIPLARHVDIGVAHWRSSIDFEWLDWVLRKLGGEAIPHKMHVEAIVWAAIAMRTGGGHLDPGYWVCWQRTPVRRLMRRFGVDGKTILKSEPWSAMKCFHAGGEAKWWLADFSHEVQRRASPSRNNPGTIQPFTELTPARYAQEEAWKRRLRRMDVYGIFR